MHAFGSGIVVPGPGKKPLHTIIPGFVSDSHGAPLLGFGVMGGFMQAQGRVQMLCRLADFGQNPQAMIDAPRFMVSPRDGSLKLEAGIASPTAAALVALGHRNEGLPYGHLDFGAAQLVLHGDGHHTAASDGRCDGQAFGF